MNIEKEMQKYKPTISLDELVVKVNKIYHSFEAEVYDQKHPEVMQQLPPIWKVMVDKFVKEKKPIYVLDYGCGTGFESQQLISNVHREQIKHITFFDASPEMLQQCRSKFEGYPFDCKFVCESEEICPEPEMKYNILLTNSLLHHLPQPFEAVRKIEEFLTDDCVWFCGHEPSKRFYQNEHCLSILNQYRHFRKIGNLFRPSQVLKKIKQEFGLDTGIAAKTAKECLKQGLFTERPKSAIIGLIVDYHVAHSNEEAKKGRGFCFQEIEKTLDSRWRLAWKTTYSFMGSFYEGSLPEKWQKKCCDLAEKYPDDGANFSSVWTRSI